MRLFAKAAILLLSSAGSAVGQQNEYPQGVSVDTQAQLNAMDTPSGLSRMGFDAENKLKELQVMVAFDGVQKSVSMWYNASTDAQTEGVRFCESHSIVGSDCEQLVEHLDSYIKVEIAGTHVSEKPERHEPSKNLYLDLLKKVVVNSVYKNEPDSRDVGHLGTPADAHTMIGPKMIRNLQYCLEDVLLRNVPGDIMETGVWRGGGSIFMRGLLKEYGVANRKVYVCDSFEGLPRPNAQAYPVDKVDLSYTLTDLAVSLEKVKDNFARYDLLDDQVVFVKGFFSDTMPTLGHVDKLAVLRLDGDMYESTWVVLQHMYDKVSPGGYIIVDDFCLRTCRLAIMEFRDRNGITAQLWRADWCGVYWQKPFR